jgi:hypothetical protein
MRLVASLSLALVALGASGFVALFGLATGALRCDDACSIQNDYWTSNKDAWQWNAIVLLALVLFFAAVLLVFGIGKRTGSNALAFVGLVGQAASLLALWTIAQSTSSRDAAREPLAWLATLIVLSGGTAILLRERSDELPA